MKHEDETAQPAPLGQVERGVGRPVPERSIVGELQAALARQTAGEPMTEGELWSFLRSVMSQGADIRTDYDMGVHKGYEAYSARLDAAAAERAEQLWVRLKTPNVRAKPALPATED
jgi:hypothetical protein